MLIPLDKLVTVTEKCVEQFSDTSWSFSSNSQFIVLSTNIIRIFKSMGLNLNSFSTIHDNLVLFLLIFEHHRIYLLYYIFVVASSIYLTGNKPVCLLSEIKLSLFEPHSMCLTTKLELSIIYLIFNDVIHNMFLPTLYKKRIISVGNKITNFAEEAYSFQGQHIIS